MSAADAEPVPVTGVETHLLARRHRLDKVGHEIHVAAGGESVEVCQVPDAAAQVSQDALQVRHELAAKPTQPARVVFGQVGYVQARRRRSVRLDARRVADGEERAKALDLLDWYGVQQLFN
jgi:hypothetical protein